MPKSCEKGFKTKLQAQILATERYNLRNNIVKMLKKMNKKKYKLLLHFYFSFLLLNTT